MVSNECRDSSEKYCRNPEGNQKTTSHPEECDNAMLRTDHKKEPVISQCAIGKRKQFAKDGITD
jgi:hypothetical protein